MIRLNIQYLIFIKSKLQLVLKTLKAEILYQYRILHFADHLQYVISINYLYFVNTNHIV